MDDSASRPARPLPRALAMACAARPSAPRTGEPPALGRGDRLVDAHGRAIRYLRLSVTDRCNLRCGYCTPVRRGDFLPRSSLLTDDEIIEILRVMAEHGLEKVRFTGGEPLVRPGFVELVRRVRAIAGIRKLCVTTNGVLLERLAEPLRTAGIDHWNVSLDTLRPERFRTITGGGSIEPVLRGIDRLIALGDESVKINVVLMRGINDDEIDAFLDLTRHRPLGVRFIEFMPLAHCGQLHDVRYLSAEHVLRRLEARGAIGPLGRGPLDGPARYWRLRGARGKVGVISAVSDTHFCDRCNRVRLSADGRLKLCLFGDAWIDLRAAVRTAAPPPRRRDAIERALALAMARKPEKMAGFADFSMMAIGG